MYDQIKSHEGKHFKVQQSHMGIMVVVIKQLVSHVQTTTCFM